MFGLSWTAQRRTLTTHFPLVTSNWCGCRELSQLLGAAGERQLEVIVVVGTVRWVPLILWFLYPLNSDCSGPFNTHSPMRDYGITKPASLEKVKWNLMWWKQSKHLTPLWPAWFYSFRCRRLTLLSEHNMAHLQLIPCLWRFMGSARGIESICIFGGIMEEALLCAPIHLEVGGSFFFIW